MEGGSPCPLPHAHLNSSIVCAHVLSCFSFRPLPLLPPLYSVLTGSTIYLPFYHTLPAAYILCQASMIVPAMQYTVYITKPPPAYGSCTVPYGTSYEASPTQNSRCFHLPRLGGGGCTLPINKTFAIPPFYHFTQTPTPYLRVTTAEQQRRNTLGHCGGPPPVTIPVLPSSCNLFYEPLPSPILSTSLFPFSPSLLASNPAGRSGTPFTGTPPPMTTCRCRYAFCVLLIRCSYPRSMTRQPLPDRTCFTVSAMAAHVALFIHSWRRTCGVHSSITTYLTDISPAGPTYLNCVRVCRRARQRTRARDVRHSRISFWRSLPLPEHYFILRAGHGVPMRHGFGQ